MEEGTARSGSEGYVYILVNPTFTGYAKIGKMTKDPAIRAKELSSSTGVPAPYAVAWDAVVNDRHYVERLVHRRLAHARARNDRKFFAVPLREAVSVLAEVATPYLLERGTLQRTTATEAENPPACARALGAVRTRAVQQPGRPQRWAAAIEELIQVSEDSKAVRGEEPPGRGVDKMVARIQFEVSAENPYRFTEHEFYYEVHVVRRNRPDLRIESYNIKRIPLLKRYGWGIHRDAEGKLALVACESDRCQESLADPTVKKTRAYRRKAPKMLVQGNLLVGRASFAAKCPKASNLIDARNRCSR